MVCACARASIYIYYYLGKYGHFACENSCGPSVSLSVKVVGRTFLFIGQNCGLNHIHTQLTQGPGQEAPGIAPLCCGRLGLKPGHAHGAADDMDHGTTRPATYAEPTQSGANVEAAGGRARGALYSIVEWIRPKRVNMIIVSQKSTESPTKVHQERCWQKPCSTL